MLPKTVTVHCRSKNNDLGSRDLNTWDEYSWSFGNNAFGGTLFWCDLRIAKANQCLHFDAYDQDDNKHVYRWEVHGAEGITGTNQDGAPVGEVAEWRQC
ncbi:unnamed protein product [Linum tenue]|uniref:S-protein homolog n=1 Tax=Linum tenue TaxID=586396 RepID=A0AAV0IDQ1_9ROSI|nr:unnamed protein product [Linum tenue]